MVTCPFCEKELASVPKPGPGSVLGVCGACMNPVAFRAHPMGWVPAKPAGVQDVRQFASEGSIGGEILKALPEAIENLPVLPEIAHRIMNLLRDPDMDLQHLAALINEDPVIALRILKLANSAMYGGLTEIKDLKAACSRLGMRVVANAVQAVANGRLYQSVEPQYKAPMETLWRHAVASAHCANEIAVMLAEPCADIHFVAGLVHDVGKVLLLDVIAHHSAPIFTSLRETPVLMEEVLDNYHALVGLHIVHHWNLPPEFAVSTFCHEKPESVPDESWTPLIHTVTLASAIANVSGFGFEPRSMISLVSLPSAKFLNVNDVRLATLRIDLEDKVTPLLELVLEK